MAEMVMVHTRSKAVEHARGWVATKIGFVDIVMDFREGSTDISRFAGLLVAVTCGDGGDVQWCL